MQVHAPNCRKPRGWQAENLRHPGIIHPGSHVPGGRVRAVYKETIYI